MTLVCSPRVSPPPLRITLALTLALLAASSVLPARAQTEAGSAPAGPPTFYAERPADLAPSVEELVREALGRSPAIAALRAQVAAAREMERPAAALPDPMVEAMVVEAGFPKNTIGEEEMSMAGVEVRQGLLYPGKRGAAGAAARARTTQREAELAALERQVAAEVRGLYARLYALDREAEALGAARELVEMLSATAAARYAAGEAEQEAVVKAQIEVSRLGEKLDDLAAERAGMTSELNRWLDLPGDAPLGMVRALPQVTFAPRPWEEAVVARSAEVAVGKAALAVADRQVEVAELELKPNLSTGAGVGFRGSMDPVVTLRFGLELPFWRRQKQLPMLRAAEHEREMARQELRDREAMARAEAARLAAEWTRSERQIARFRDAIVPQTSVALDAARSSYLAGRGDFSTVIEDFNLWLEARVELARREAERFAAWADLERLTGIAGAAPSQGVTP